MDLLVTESVPRMVLVAIWTGLGMVLADVGPGVWKDSGGRRIWSRFKRDMKVMGRRMPRMPMIAIPFLDRPRTVRFVPSSRSRTTSVVSPTSSAVSGPTYSVVSTATAPTAPTATTRTVPRFAGTPAASVYSTTTTSSTTASSVTPPEPAEPPVSTGPAVSVHPPTPGTTPTPRKTRVPGHFMRDSETETEITTLPRNRISRRKFPYTGPSTNSSGSASGLTTDNELLGTSRGSRYSLFPVSTKKPDLRLTESDSDDDEGDDDTSSTTTETPTPDAGTLRDISLEVVEAAEAEQSEQLDQITPTQSPVTTEHPILSNLPDSTNDLNGNNNELLITGIDLPTVPKTPLPPADQVPDIPDVDVDYDSWEKVEKETPFEFPLKKWNTKGKAKVKDDELDAKSEVSVKGKGKAKNDELEAKSEFSVKGKAKDEGLDSKSDFSIKREGKAKDDELDAKSEFSVKSKAKEEGLDSKSEFSIRGKGKVMDDEFDAKSEFSVKGKGKTKTVTPALELAPGVQAAQPRSQHPTPGPPESKTPEPITPIPPRLPPKENSKPVNTSNSSSFNFSTNQDPKPLIDSKKSTLISSAKPEKAMSEPGWLDSFGDLVGKNKNKTGKPTKTKSVVSAVSSVAGITDAFVKPGATGWGLGSAGRSPLSGNATPIAADETKSNSWSNPWGSVKANTKAPSEINASVDKRKSERSQPSPPPTWSQTFPDGAPNLFPDDSASGYQDITTDKDKKEKEGGSFFGGATTGNITPSAKAASTKAPSAKAPSIVSVSPKGTPELPQPIPPSVKALSAKALSTVSVSPKERSASPRPAPKLDDGAAGDSSSPPENETNDNEVEKTKEKAKTEADAKEEEAEEEKEVDSDTELLPSNASSSAKLELSLDLLKQINGLRKVQKEGDGYDKQIAKQIRKLERRVERISFPGTCQFIMSN